MSAARVYRNHLLSTLVANWRFGVKEGWTFRVRCFNTFFLIVHAYLPRRLAHRVTDAVR